MKTVPKLFAVLLIAVLLPFTATASSLTVVEKQSVKLAVTADGTTPFTYQWIKNGVAISGATSSTYVIASCTLSDAATYTVRVTNSAGSAVSDNAILTVNLLIIAPSNAITSIVLN